MWVIDENAIIDFIFVCIIPEAPPTSTFIREIVIISFRGTVFMFENIKIDSGAIFCNVLRMRQDHQEIDVITDGNHM